MARERYTAQVALLVRALPVIADEPSFALKGGTAINLFYRDMPRLSVDIDLTYLPLDDRATALAAIDTAFDRMVERARQLLPGVDARRINGGGDVDTRLLLRAAGAEVKVEVSPVLRGMVAPPRVMRVTTRSKKSSASRKQACLPSRTSSRASCAPRSTASIRATCTMSICCTSMKASAPYAPHRNRLVAARHRSATVRL